MPQPQQQAQQQEQAQPKPSRATMNRWEYLDMVRKNFPFAKGLENKELWKMLTDKNPDAKNWKFKDSPRDIQNKEEQKATSIFLNELNLKNLDINYLSCQNFKELGVLFIIMKVQELGCTLIHLNLMSMFGFQAMNQ